MLNKQSYFQGTEEPKPGKKQHKSEKATMVQPRFKEPLYRNYDLYDVPGEHGPGVGWHSVQNYKSIGDFLKARRKKLKDKYKSDDRKIKVRAKLLSRLIKIAIDFPIDDQIGSSPILGDAGSYSDSVPFGGLGDYANPLHDFEDKSPDQLNFGRDYEEGSEQLDERKVQSLMDKHLNIAEPPIFGLPDGISPPEDLDPEATINHINPYFGTTDVGTQIYEDKWNI